MEIHKSHVPNHQADMSAASAAHPDDPPSDLRLGSLDGQRKKGCVRRKIQNWINLAYSNAS